MNERKAEELRRKTFERIAVQRGIKQASVLAQLEIEESKRRKEEVAILKADERLHVMNALRMQTLKRYICILIDVFIDVL
jgi:inosine/xanthosine triphosphate pyrophosphatase family protein